MQGMPRYLLTKCLILDDMWAISTTSRFGGSQTFLGRSLYYGPSKENFIELQLVGENDEKISKSIISSSNDESTQERLKFGKKQQWQEPKEVVALRCLSSSNEWTMIGKLVNSFFARFSRC